MPFPCLQASIWMMKSLESPLVCLRVGTPFRHPHICHQCGSQVDQLGNHGLSCSKSHCRHSVAMAFARIDQGPFTSRALHYLLFWWKESIVPWKNDCVLVWDVTWVDTIAPSYATMVSNGPGCNANRDEYLKKGKYAYRGYSSLCAYRHETTWVFGSEANYFIHELGACFKRVWWSSYLSVPTTINCSCHPVWERCSCAWIKLSQWQS